MKYLSGELTINVTETLEDCEELEISLGFPKCPPIGTTFVHLAITKNNQPYGWSHIYDHPPMWIREIMVAYEY